MERFLSIIEDSITGEFKLNVKHGDETWAIGAMDLAHRLLIVQAIDNHRLTKKEGEK